MTKNNIINVDLIQNELPDTSLKTSDFFYELPEELIAQTPLYPRDSSRLMVLDRESKKIEHRIFHDITEYLRPNDTLVINDSRVIPARIFGKSEKGADVELLLLRQRGADTWETLVRPGKRARIGSKIDFSGMMTAEITDIIDEGNRIARFEYDREKYKSVYEILHEIGLMPLPPYITQRLEDSERYQTVYSKEEGSAAAPTAGLHFTNELLDKIKSMGIAVVPVMLHGGLGTFRPVKAESITDHHMHSEFITVTPEAADTINNRRAAGGRIIAVGTTSCRTLESAADDSGIIQPICGDTGIFIYPGYKFKAVDARITNFHLPESTLLMLVSALAGREFIMQAYETAVREKYRFFSFGDAMFIL